MDSSVGKVILGALRRGPRSGYEIKRLVDRSTRFFWAASYGQIYPELHRLEEQGLIVGETDPRDRRRRRVYRLTPAGRQALREWLLKPAMTKEMRDEGLLKLFFADALSSAEALALVRSMRMQRQEVLDRLREIADKVPTKQGIVFPLVVLEYGIGLHRWMVDWCEELERRLVRETAAGTKEVAKR